MSFLCLFCLLSGFKTRVSTADIRHHWQLITFREIPSVIQLKSEKKKKENQIISAPDIRNVKSVFYLYWKNEFWSSGSEDGRCTNCCFGPQRRCSKRSVMETGPDEVLRVFKVGRWGGGVLKNNTLEYHQFLKSQQLQYCCNDELHVLLRRFSLFRSVQCLPQI